MIRLNALCDEDSNSDLLFEFLDRFRMSQGIVYNPIRACESAMMMFMKHSLYNNLAKDIEMDFDIRIYWDLYNYDYD